MSVMKQFYTTHADEKSKIIGIKKYFSKKENKVIAIPLRRKNEKADKE